MLEEGDRQILEEKREALIDLAESHTRAMDNYMRNFQIRLAPLVRPGRDVWYGRHNRSAGRDRAQKVHRGPK